MTSTTGVPAGWYDDPQSPSLTRRYWDGMSWTEHVAPHVPAGAPRRDHAHPEQVRVPLAARPGAAPTIGQHPTDPIHWLVPTGRSWQSIASGYVGLVSLALFFLGPAAIVLGFLGLRAADRQGTHGRGRSIFGIVTGCIGTLFGLLVLFG